MKVDVHYKDGTSSSIDAVSWVAHTYGFLEVFKKNNVSSFINMDSVFWFSAESSIMPVPPVIPSVKTKSKK